MTGFDTDRDVFLGPYRSYHNPLVVEKGQCTNSLAAGDNGCGVLQVDVDLKPGEEQELAVLMGIGKAVVEGKQVLGDDRALPDLNVNPAFPKHLSYLNRRTLHRIP